MESQSNGSLWDDLSSEEKEELLLSYEESFNVENLMDHEEVKKLLDERLKKINLIFGDHLPLARKKSKS